jgi:flagellar biosynthetic protein FliR
MVDRAPEAEIGPLVAAILLQVLAGLVLGFIAMILFSAVQAAGELIDLFSGFTVASLYDPLSNSTSSMFGRLHQLIAVTLLFATDSHHLVIAALNDSYKIFSPGELMPSGDVAALATRAFAAAFKIGMQLSAPFLVFGLVFNIGLGVLARLMPAMQVYFVGVPLSIMIGFLIFALVISAMMGTYLNYFTGVMHDLTPLR